MGRIRPEVVEMPLTFGLDTFGLTGCLRFGVPRLACRALCFQKILRRDLGHLASKPAPHTKQIRSSDLLASRRRSITESRR